MVSRDSPYWPFFDPPWTYEKASKFGTSLADTYGPNKWQPGARPMSLVRDQTIRQIEYKLLKPDAKVPQRAIPTAIGLDVFAYLKTESGRASTIMIPERGSRLVPTGVVVIAPPGYFLLVFSRSGMAKNSVFQGNGVGLIDPDYTGEMGVLLYNGSHTPYYIKHEDRIGQLVLMPIVPTTMVEAFEVPETPRGPKGFGSTGR